MNAGRSRATLPCVSLYQAICNRLACSEYAGATHTITRLSDSDHFTVSEAIYVVGRIVEQGTALVAAGHIDLRIGEKRNFYLEGRCRTIVAR